MSAFGLALLLLPIWAYVAGVTLCAWRFARRPSGLLAAPGAGAPAVSILKPLHGAEPGLYENLLSFADQDHRQVQLLLGVRDRTDTALPVARSLIADRPQSDIELVIDPRVTGSNLKVANLENMLPRARHDILVLADSDMRVTPEYLTVVTASLADPATGVVTCLYKGAPSGGLWSRLAALYINFGFLPGALIGDAIGIGGGCFGATIALRREVLERVGGFARIRDELADDHRLGAAVREVGLNTVLSRYIVENRVDEPSFACLWRHELRWARTSRTMAPAGFAGSVITHTVVVALFAALLSGSGAAGGGVVIAALLLRFLSAGLIARRLDLPRGDLWLLPLRDALSFAVFVGSFCGRSVLWRDQLLHVERGGRMRLEGDKPV